MSEVRQISEVTRVTSSQVGTRVKSSAILRFREYFTICNIYILCRLNLMCGQMCVIALLWDRRRQTNKAGIYVN